MKKAVHFGAGSIGRGFIADLLHDTGYEIIFLDVDTALMAQINENHSYHLYEINADYRQKTIDHVTGISSMAEPEQAIEALAEADLITTSVWADNLPKIAPLLAKGLQKRKTLGKERINVLACENAMHNSQMLRKAILQQDTGLTETEVDTIAVFPNTAVDRMVLEANRNGERVIDIGADFELVIEKNALVHPEEQPIAGAIYAEDLRPYIERKLYIINCGHAWGGYLGQLHGFTTMQEVFGNAELTAEVKEVMLESAGLLAEKYDFTKEELENYIDFAIHRFQTPGIVDYISRVSRAPIRKLQPEERLVGPCMQCEERGLKNEKLIEGIAAVFLYDNPEDTQSVELLETVAKEGIAKAITKYTGIQPETRVHQQIMQSYTALQKKE